MIIKRRFPEDFYRFGNSEHTYTVSDDEINKWISVCIKQLKADESKEYSFYAVGDTMVFVERYYDEGEGEFYEATVCKNYYQESIFQKDIED